MVSLICDSATKVLYMALVIDDKVKEERYYDDGKNHSVNIVAGIYEMLVKYHIKPLEVDKFICGIGPGSYTGVRMAVTVAKMFGAFSKTKIYQISTLSLMASKQEGKVLCYIDARNGNVFGGVYLNGKALYVDSFLPLVELEKQEHDTVITPDNFKVSPLNVIANATLVLNPDLLVPNYLRDTEAERNLHE